MTTYGEICGAIEKLGDFKFVNLLDIKEFMIEQRITNKGKLKVMLEFDAKEMLKNPNSCPSKKADYIFTPFLLFVQWKGK